MQSPVNLYYLSFKRYFLSIATISVITSIGVLQTPKHPEQVGKNAVLKIWVDFTGETLVNFCQC